MAVRWMTGVLLLMAATGAGAAETTAWGRAVEGVQLGLAVAPDSGPLPSELSLEVQVRNVTSEPRQLAVEACPQVRWTAFTILHVRVASGQVFRFHIGGLIDIANIHPHGPVALPMGEPLRERFSLLPLVSSHGMSDQDSALGRQLEAPQEVELWAEIPGAPGRPKLTSGRLKHRLGLPGPAIPPPAGRCITQLTASGKAACALLRDGTPWCWGGRPPGVRSTGEDTDVAKPQPLRLLAGGCAELGMSGGILCTRTLQGTVYCAGGSLGSYDGPDTMSSQPMRVSSLEGAVQLYIGASEKCARTADGSLSCWGLPRDPNPLPEEPRATRWEASAGRVSQLALGSGHACALLEDRTLWCWGANEQGQLGTGDTARPQAPVQVTSLGQQVVSIAAGASHTCAALHDGSVRCWGRSEYGALGLGSNVSSLTPAPVPELTEVVRVAAGYQKTCAWKKDGSVWCFGELLRDMSTQPLAMTPVEMKSLGRQVEEVAFGFRHTCARTAARGDAKGGDVLCWGEAAADVTSLRGKALALTAGDDFTCALTVDGAAWCWGSGYEGQLGSGRKEDSPRPVRVRLRCQGR
jgi:hypothetical protein